MLPELFRQRFQTFRQRLQALQTTATLKNIALSELQTVQDFFQQYILSLDLEQVEPTEVAKVRSYQTEIGKQLRLLVMDALFLQTARQSATLSQRQQQMDDRISTLIDYCNAVLG